MKIDRLRVDYLTAYHMKNLIRIISLSSLCFLILSASAQEVFDSFHFRNIGPAAMSGRVVDLAVYEQDPYTFYAATATGGLWKTVNNGITFTPVFDKENTHSIGAIVLNQNNPNILYVGTGERANRQSNSWGDGLYKSNDGGKSWKHLGLSDTHHIGRIALHPTDTSIVYVAAMGHLWGPNKERGLYKSTDAGKTWKNILFINEDTGVSDVAMDPSNPNTLYAAAYQRRRAPYGFHGGGPGSALYKSTDGGVNWKKITSGLPDGDFGRIGISIYRKNPSIVYISLEQGFQYNASTAYTKRKGGVYRSENGGESFVWMSDWNPRPMYASQILVDPNDDQRIYMQNSFSFSKDGGKSFQTARQSLHGDDRIVWVNPKDSRHLIKGDDGGIGISYDQSQTWLYVTNLPVSQLYRVSVDMRNPYFVYGGFQDNGSWMGPNATYNSDGILNQDWIKTGGGDGFLNLIHPEDPNILFTESQYLGLSRLNLTTGENVDIRPGDPKGHISDRRNWEAWGPGIEEPELGNAMAPANWDGPFMISKHASNTIYAGTNKLWKSENNGNTWKEIGDLTTNVNRRELKIMGQRPDSLTASLDDGIPYYPTITIIAESPIKKGWLYVGTDDGQFQLSKNDGKTWKEISKNFPGLPKSTWVNGIEPSAVDERIVYATFNNYRNNDFSNYVYKSLDGGENWRRIDATLPANRVARTLREDPKNPNVLYLGTENGLFVSLNSGEEWISWKGNMPTLPFNDLVVHPRDNDLILGSHGRGIWILDNLTPIQEFDQASQKDSHLFTVSDATKIRYNRVGGHTGDMIYRGENPDRGVLIDYYLKNEVSPDQLSISILSSNGFLIRTLEVDTTSGIHRIIWDFRADDLPSPASNPNQANNAMRRWRSRGLSGPEVQPGSFKIVLDYKGNKSTHVFNVLEDPRIKATKEDYNQQALAINKLISQYTAVLPAINEVRAWGWKLDEMKKDGKASSKENEKQIKDLIGQYNELLNRITGSYREVESVVQAPTSDLQSRMTYFDEMIKKLEKKKSSGTIQKIVKSIEMVD